MASQIIFSIDLELFGPTNPIKAIGMAVTRQPENEVLAEFKACIQTSEWRGQSAAQFWADNKTMTRLVRSRVPEKYRHLFFQNCGFEYHCLKNFWVRRFKLLESLESSAVPFQTAVKQFLWFYDAQTKQYGSNVVVVSDNPAMDIGQMDAILRQKGRLPLQYRRAGLFSEILDVKMLIRGLMHISDPRDSTYIQKFLTCFKHNLAYPDHDPLNDALWIAHLYGLYLQSITILQNIQQVQQGGPK